MPRRTSDPDELEILRRAVHMLAHDAEQGGTANVGNARKERLRRKTGSFMTATMRADDHKRARPLRLIGYARVSTTAQGEQGHGLGAQSHELARYAKAQGHPSWCTSSRTW